MKIHHYNETTGEWVGEGVADADPLEAGRWLIPAHATTEQPPEPGEGKFVAWNGTAWEVRDITPPPPEPEPVPAVEPEPVPAVKPAPVTEEQTTEPTPMA